MGFEYDVIRRPSRFECPATNPQGDAGSGTRLVNPSSSGERDAKEERLGRDSSPQSDLSS